MNSAVAVCIFNREEMVLLERKGLGHRNEPGQFVFPGGLVEDGESSIGAIRREIAEELGVSGMNLDLGLVYGSRNYQSPTGQQFRIDYFVVHGWLDLVKLCPAFEFVPIEAARMELIHHRRLVVERAREIHRARVF